jgi:hypothetical protein
VAGYSANDGNRDLNYESAPAAWQTPFFWAAICLAGFRLDAIRTERAFLKSERRNIFVESRDFRNAR